MSAHFSFLANMNFSDPQENLSKLNNFTKPSNLMNEIQYKRLADSFLWAITLF